MNSAIAIRISKAAVVNLGECQQGSFQKGWALHGYFDPVHTLGVPNLHIAHFREQILRRDRQFSGFSVGI
jgi:hypothetical protein